MNSNPFHTHPANQYTKASVNQQRGTNPHFADGRAAVPFVSFRVRFGSVRFRRVRLVKAFLTRLGTGNRPIHISFIWFSPIYYFLPSSERATYRVDCSSWYSHSTQRSNLNFHIKYFPLAYQTLSDRYSSSVTIFSIKCPGILWVLFIFGLQILRLIFHDSPVHKRRAGYIYKRIESFVSKGLDTAIRA